MDFGEVLSRAWKIVWKFKVLWIFGVFASCGTRNGGSFNGGGSSGYETNGAPGSTPSLPPGFVNNMERLVSFFANPAVLTVFFSVICILVLLTIFLSIMGRIGLIKGALKADGGAERLTFSELWSAGLHYFWRFLGLSLLVGSPVVLFYILILVGAFAFIVLPAIGSNSTSNVASGILVFLPVLCALGCVVFLLAIVISFLSPQAENAVVVENEGVISGLKRGWQVLTKNLGPILVIWLILLVVGIVAGILIALPVLIIVVPAVIAFIGSNAVNGSNLSFTPLIVAGLCLVAYIPVSLLANGILMAYVQSVWTLTYIRLTQPKQDAQTPIAVPNA